MELSIIIVNYNVKHFLEQALRSVYNAIENVDAEVFVVDNNSTDGSMQMVEEKFPQAYRIANKENVGFAKANNQAIALSKGKYVLLLNPDTLVGEETLRKCVDFFEKTPDAGGLGLKMINGKGDFLPESKRGLPLPSVAFYKIFGLSKLFPRSKKFGTYHLSYLDKNQNHSVEVLSGAFMMMRKELLDKIGYLDETFFMYGEDIDLSYRIVKAGYKNYYFSETEIIHYKGESTKKDSVNYVLVFYKAMSIFVKKHFSQGKAGLFTALMNIAIWFRASLAILQRIAKRIALPIVDFVTMYVGMFALSAYWEYAILAHRNSFFPDEFRYLFLPAFVLIWIVSMIGCKGYKSPYSFQKTNRGLIVGTIIILLIYALLPEHLRFSRAMIVFGAMWAALAINSMRYLLQKLRLGNYNFAEDKPERVLIVGGDSSAENAAKLLLNVCKECDFLGRFNPQKISEEECVTKIIDKVKTLDINRMIFCTADISLTQTIRLMELFSARGIRFEIMPEEMDVIIGPDEIIQPITLVEVQ